MMRASAVALVVVALLAPAGCHRRVLPGEPAPAQASGGESEAAGLRFIERITGGARATDPLPLIVGIHGRGGRPDRFGETLASLSIPARVILPYGPEPHGFGFTWFSDWSDDAEFAAVTQKAADRLAAMIGELVAHRPTVGKPIVTGFSQGGILSFTLAVLHPDVIGAAFPVGGLLARPLVPSSWPPGAAKPTIRAFHGTADETVPFEGARATVRRLADLGLTVELSEYPGLGHTITRPEAGDLVRAIEAAAAQKK